MVLQCLGICFLFMKLIRVLPFDYPADDYGSLGLLALIFVALSSVFTFMQVIRPNMTVHVTSGRNVGDARGLRPLSPCQSRYALCHTAYGRLSTNGS